ncbi:RNA demethylase ALKBH10B-like [Nymphaea colorata]|nr:RNA demethylase ALKBH10B-like [Nymphaea colorata]
MDQARVSRSPATDALLSWFRSEFTAANAIIDALCYHLRGVASSDLQQEYDHVFAAIHRRRMNWIPILHAQTYFSIAEIVAALGDAAAARKPDGKAEKWKIAATEVVDVEEMNKEVVERKVEKEAGSEEEEKNVVAMAEEKVEKEAGNQEEEKNVESETEVMAKKEEQKEETRVGAFSVEKRVTPGEGKELQSEGSVMEKDDPAPGDLGISVLGSNSSNAVEDLNTFSEYDDLNEGPERVRTTKGFSAKEPIDGHMVNVVKGLKLYDGIFTELELSRLVSIADELRVAGQKGELSGETYISFNKQLKGNRREMIQLGIPVFGQKKDKPSYVEPIPTAFEAAIDRLVHWHLIPESRKPNCCIINFFDEGECSQPYLRPPHIEHPISTLSLSSDCKMVFGRIFMSDRHGNYKGSLELPLNEGSLVVMRGNSASTTHAICPSPSKRTTVTFVKVCTDGSNHARPVVISRKPLLARRMTLWQVSGLQEKDFSCKLADDSSECGQVDGVPKLGLLPIPLVSAAPGWPMVVQRRRPPVAGTGVFIPSKTDAAGPRNGSRMVRETDNSEDNVSA